MICIFFPPTAGALLKKKILWQVEGLREWCEDWPWQLVQPPLGATNATRDSSSASPSATRSAEVGHRMAR